MKLGFPEKPKKTYADDRFIKFMNILQNVIVTEQVVVDYYLEHIRRTELNRLRKSKQGNVTVINYGRMTEAEIKADALGWFDRSLGRVLRKNLIKL